MPNTNNDLTVKIEIKRKGYEVSTESNISTITQTIDSLVNFVNLLDGKFSNSEIMEEREELPQSSIPVGVSPTPDIPAIKPAKSTSESISLLFDTPWGKTPRTLGEVVKALEINAVYDQVQIISNSLIRAVKKGILRRIPRDGQWVYVKTSGN